MWSCAHWNRNDRSLRELRKIAKKNQRTDALKLISDPRDSLANREKWTTRQGLGDSLY